MAALKQTMPADHPTSTHSQPNVTALQPIRWSLAVVSLLSDLLVEHRKAQVATRLYEQLRMRSPSDLAKAGLRREDIANEIYVRLYGGQPNQPHE